MYPKSAAWMPQISETYFTCHTERMGVAPLAHCVPLRVPCRTPWLWPAHQRVAGNKKLSAGAQRSGPSVCAGIVFFSTLLCWHFQPSVRVNGHPSPMSYPLAMACDRHQQTTGNNLRRCSTLRPVRLRFPELSSHILLFCFNLPLFQQIVH